MIVKPEELPKFYNKIGPKTHNLAELLRHNLNVPSFIAVSSDTIENLYLNNQINPDILSSIIEEIKKELPSERYAVRSSALIEDSGKNSYAGQFLTKIDLGSEELSQAIEEVVNHAREYLRGDLSKFSLIIQKYIKADFSGITFTRNPQGGREIVIEYYRGIGENIVGGKVTPEKIQLYWTESTPKLILPCLQEAVEIFKDTETFFKYPQDIEWCIQDKKWYFLQARPITTITADEYQGYLYLDSGLPKNQPFLLEKTEISEIAPRPTPFTLSLLYDIYGGGGPVETIYKKYGIQYAPGNFLTIVGNELYIDREKELKTFFPSYSYFGLGKLKPRWRSFTHISQTLYNILALTKIPLRNYAQLKELALQKLNSHQSSTSLEESLMSFLKDYELIFETNLLATKALHKLEIALKNKSVGTAEVLKLPLEGTEKLPEVNLSLTLLGNSLEITDTSKFFQSNITYDNNSKLWVWWDTLPAFKKNYLAPIIIKAQNFNNLREYCRWLTIKNISGIRRCLIQAAKNIGLDNTDLIYFATSQEIKNGIVIEKLCVERKRQYEKYSKYISPISLTHTYITQPSRSCFGVSKGQAKGILVALEDIDNVRGDKILYTKILSPHLTKFFPQIKGIISEQGSLLSHLAIIARECGMPVIVNFNLSESNLKEGDTLEMDSSKGEVKKL